LTDRSC